MASAVGEPQLLFPCDDGLATLAIVEEGHEAAAERHEAGRAGWVVPDKHASAGIHPGAGGDGASTGG